MNAPDHVNHLLEAWPSIVFLLQLVVGGLVGWGVRLLREIRTDVAGVRNDVSAVKEELRKINGRVGRLEQRIGDHEKLDDDRHTRAREDVSSLFDRLERLTERASG